MNDLEEKKQAAIAAMRALPSALFDSWDLSEACAVEAMIVQVKDIGAGEPAMLEAA